MESLKPVLTKWFDSTGVKYWELNCIISIQSNKNFFFSYAVLKGAAEIHQQSLVLLRQAASVHLNHESWYLCVLSEWFLCTLEYLSCIFGGPKTSFHKELEKNRRENGIGVYMFNTFGFRS